MPSQNSKEDNLEAIRPQKNSPILISTTNQTKKTMFGRIGGVLLVLFLIAAIGLWYSNKQLTELKAKSANANANTETLLEKLAHHVMLPVGEEPNISTIGDPAQFTQYPNVKAGQQLISYSNLEIVYDSNLDVVLYARPMSGQAQSSIQSSTTPVVAGTEARAVQGTITIDIRNGSGTVGVAAKTADTFKGVTDYEIKNIGNAKKSSYAKTILVNLTGKNIEGLEKQFKTTAVTALPAGEKASTSDVVIIVGKS